jgi:hypothetical protein
MGNCITEDPSMDSISLWTQATIFPWIRRSKKPLDYIQRKKLLDALCDEGRVSHDYHHYL